MMDDADVVVLPPGRAITASCLLLSPHSDDVAFSLGAALVEGRFACGCVVTVFSISACTADDTGDGMYSVTTLRKSEDRKFAGMIVPALEWHHLDHQDAPLRLGLSEDAVCTCPEEWRDVAGAMALVQTLRKALKEHSVVVLPLGLGGHIDHRTLVDAVIGGLPCPASVAFYEDLPYAGGIRLSAIATHAQAVSRQVGDTLRPCVLRSRFSPRDKLRLVSVYKSQMDQYTSDRIMAHGRRLWHGGVAERLWCNHLALSRILEPEVPACSEMRPL